MRLPICVAAVTLLACNREPPAAAWPDLLGASAPPPVAAVDLRARGETDLAPPINSGGCGTSATPGAAMRTLDVNGVPRSYLLVVPASYDPTRAYPVVFGWHGLTWQAAAFRPSIDVEGPAAGEAIFVYPQGLETAGLPAQATGGVTGLGWDWREDGRDVALFDALVIDLEANLCIDHGRLFSYGRSHGGFFSHALACFRGNVLRAAADAIGGKPGTIDGGQCQRSIPVWITHNADDPTVPIALAEAARDLWRSVDDCSADATATTPSPCVRYTCNQGTAVHWCASATGGHTPAAYAGQAIWAFFAAQP